MIKFKRTRVVYRYQIGTSGGWACVWRDAKGLINII